MEKIKIDSDDEFINLSPSTTQNIFEYKNTEYLPLNFIWLTNNISKDKKKIFYLKSILKKNDYIKVLDNIELAKNYFSKNIIDFIIINFDSIKDNIDFFTFLNKNYVNVKQCIVISNENNNYTNFKLIKSNNYENEIKNIIDTIIRIPKVHLRSLKKKGSWSSKSYINKFKNNVIKI